jgi:hypothetical protein
MNEADLTLTIDYYVGCWRAILGNGFQWEKGDIDDWIDATIRGYKAFPEYMLHYDPMHFIALEVVGRFLRGRSVNIDFVATRKKVQAMLSPNGPFDSLHSSAICEKLGSQVKEFLASLDLG